MSNKNVTQCIQQNEKRKNESVFTSVLLK